MLDVMSKVVGRAMRPKVPDDKLVSNPGDDDGGQSTAGQMLGGAWPIH